MRCQTKTRRKCLIIFLEHNSISVHLEILNCAASVTMNVSVKLKKKKKKKSMEKKQIFVARFDHDR